MKTYTITQEQMDRLHGAAHGGAMLGSQSAYEGCLKVGAILAEISFKERFDKSPGSAPETVTIMLPHGYADGAEFAADCGFELVR